MTVAAVTPAEAPERSRRGDAFLVLGLAVGIVAVAVARLAAFGWAEIAPDDARYVYVGLSTLDGHGPITPSGNVFLLRSPVYGIALATGRWLGDGGPIGGARIVGAGLAVTALVGAVALSHSLAGVTAAVGTTLAILAMTLIWRLVPTIRIDLPQTAGVVAVLLALQRPTIRRWAVAGALLGLTILVKETVILLAAAPLAFVGSIASRRLVRLWAGYLGLAVLVAGWWWVVVWTVSGALFPLNAVAVIEGRDVGTDLLLDTFGLGLAGLAVAAWSLVAGLARDDRRIRLLVAAAACLLPP
ncbi:MAG TPA: hypothetical protein VK194_00215, partial [Candidatus Deferrimicrobium sp.]|nr:hypothetical protein [Candidatus Deferrimicrobium sp.]